MTTKTWLWACVLAGACGTTTDDDLGTGTGPGDKLGDRGALEIFVSTPGGARMPGNLFASKADVYLDALLDGVPLPFGTIAPRDYYFHVVDGAGHMVSTADPLCRRLRIGDAGRIDTLYDGASAGVACPHLTGVDMINRYGNGITVGLAPFADASVRTIDGAPYRVELFATDNFEGISEPVVAIDFVVTDAPPTPPTCGNGIVEDGEACDDDNTLAGDGCDPACNHEPNPPVCGNGVVEDGEGCDDGNIAGMDGCNVHCEVEHLCCCGNGDLEPGEACDDGNQNNGDGCSAHCAIE